VAWRVLDTLAARHGAREAGKDTTWSAREASIAGQPTVLLQPLRFMNVSGWSSTVGCPAIDASRARQVVSFPASRAP